MSELKVLNLSEGQLEVKETLNEIYIVNNKCNITIKSGVNAKILDTSNEEVNIDVEDGAFLSYYILESKNAKRVFNVKGEVELLEVSLEETNEFLNVNLLTEDSRFNSRCLSFASKVKSEFHTDVKHMSKYSFSNVANTGVAMEGGKLLFDVVGKIEKGMAKSKCSQVSRGIVMDNISKVDAKPILLIDEYDSLANHGASIGKVSDEDLFYLMSRGLTKNDACLLILEGIIRPFVDSIPLDDYKERISKKVSELR